MNIILDKEEYDELKNQGDDDGCGKGCLIIILICIIIGH